MNIKILFAASAAVGLMSGAAMAQDKVHGYGPGDAVLQDEAAVPKTGLDNSPVSPNTVNPAPYVGAQGTTTFNSPTASLPLMPVPNTNLMVPDLSQDARIPVNVDVAVRASIPLEPVANAPIPDTPENRAKYGAPMSRSGQLTTPAGN